MIACINGYALAGGLELALSCDIVIADESAELGDEHIRRNLLPGAEARSGCLASWGCRALLYLLTGRRMTGREAQQMGLVSMAVPAGELESVTMEFASELARVDPHALASMKFAVRRGMELPLKEALWLERWTQYRYRIASPALENGVAEFGRRPGATLPGDAPNQDERIPE